MGRRQLFGRGEGGYPWFFSATGAALLLFAVVVSPETRTGIRFSNLGTIGFPTVCAFVFLGIVSLLCGAFEFWIRRGTKRGRTVSTALGGAILIAAAIVGAGMGGRLDVVGLAAQSLKLATPIALGAVSGVLCERSGVINIAIEGMMLSAACVGFTVALYAQSLWAGLAAAVFAGMIMAAIHAVLSVGFSVDQIIGGTAINILAVGSTGFIRRAFLVGSDLPPPGVFPRLPIPLLADIPVAGKILFQHQPMVYAMFASVFIVAVALFRTGWGLRTRAVGEHPYAADSAGIDVTRIRFGNVVLAGAVAGLGGAWFSLETVGDFEELMTGGKGFIALAAMIFGNWRPVGALGGALLFGFADALQIKLQISGVELPYQFLGMAPYIVTIVVLAGFVGRAAAPAAVGKPYKREA